MIVLQIVKKTYDLEEVSVFTKNMKTIDFEANPKINIAIPQLKIIINVLATFLFCDHIHIARER